MDSLHVLWILFTFPLLAFGRRGFILTAPKVLDAGTTEHLSLTLSDVPSEGKVEVKLLKALSKEVLSEVTVDLYGKNDHTSWVQLPIPAVEEQTAYISVQGIFNSSSDNYRINSVKEIRLRNKGAVIFIQTDKAVYKPGQTVKFRILPVDVHLHPLPNAIGYIWIEDPLGVRVAQWKKVTFLKGIFHQELILSDEPNLGKWTIKALIANVTKTQLFEVWKYVLPKYEVYVKPPPFVMANAEIITWLICAKYTFGKNVEGMMKGRVSYKAFNWEKSNEAFPYIDFYEPIEGCRNLTVLTKELEMQKRIYSYRSLIIEVEVRENGTGVTQNSSNSIEIEHNPLKITFASADNGPLYFKPGLPYYGKLIVSLPDGKSALNEEIKICATFSSEGVILKNLCKQMKTDSKGHIYFTVPPQDQRMQKMSIEAKAVNHDEQLFEKWGVMLFKPQASLFLKPWYSPSGSYLQIEPNYQAYDCSKPVLIPVKYITNAGSRIKFYHQVLSRGRIVNQGSDVRTFDVSEDKRFENNDNYLNDGNLDQKDNFNFNSHNETLPVYVGQFHILFDPRPPIGPTAQLLVFYIRADGEVVADSSLITIQKCLQNKVSLEFKYEQQYPGTMAPISLSADSFSFCGIRAVDKSVHLLNPAVDITKSNIFSVLNELILNRHSLPKQVSEDYCKKQMTKEGGEDLNKNDEEVTNLMLKKKRSLDVFEYFDSNHVDSMMAFEETGIVVISDLILEVRPCVKSGFMDLSDRFEPIPINRISSQDVSREKVVEQATKKSVEIRNFFPETWLWETVIVGESGNLVVARDLPHTITEWIGDAFCVNPTTGIGVSEFTTVKTFQPFFVDIIHPFSIVRGEIVPIAVTVFNFLQEMLSVKVSFERTEDFKVINGSWSHKMCIRGSKSSTHKFNIKPQKLGIINITVHAYSLQDDVLCNGDATARLEARDSMTKPLIVEPEGYPNKQVEKVYFCPSDYDGIFHHEFNFDLPENIVKGSASAKVSVSGDIMGPAIEGLEKLIRLPVGCGEQNMVLFSPNIFILDYLFATNRGTDEFKTKAINYLKTGYQRELTYRHDDGSYSAFGKSDKEGSMWLTAFVIKSFFQATNYIDIDHEDLEKSISWIVQNQLENGCFPQKGMLLNAQMKGGLHNDETTLAPLSAYVMIALLESGFNTSKVTENGFYCLMAEQNPNSYMLALFAYAAVLAEHPLAESYLNQLEQKSERNEEVMYWTDEVSNSKSVSVEIASYAILSMMNFNSSANIVKALPIVRWIVQQQNANGGFVSTQDTVVALQALSLYATYATQEMVDLSSFVKGDGFHFSFSVNNDNMLLMQSQRLPVIPQVVNLQSVGDGCAVAQVTLKYHVESVPDNGKFYLQVESKWDDFDCSVMRIRACFRYLLTGRTSNMAVMEIKSLSGYNPDEKSLLLLRRMTDLSLKRYEVTSNTINFYFDEITNEEKCLSFDVKEEIPVENIQPALAKLYDYYQPEFTVSTSYFIQDVCQLGTNMPETFFGYDDLLLNISISPTSKDAAKHLHYLDSPNAGEESLLNKTGNTSSLPLHLTNFVDVNYELQFPDGLEGNQLVTAFPPDFEPADEGSVNCPACWSSHPSDFASLYCHSVFALKVQIRNITNKRMKLLQDVSASKPKAVNLKAFSKYILLDSCECFPLLKVNNYAVILGASKSIWQTGKLHSLTMNKEAIIISFEAQNEITKEIKKAKKTCTAMF